MEFEERRKTSQRVQFWLLVQGLKDPLEEHFASPRIDSNESSQSSAEIALDDLRLIWETYLARDQFRSSPSHLSTIQAFVERSDQQTSTLHDLRRVRQAVFALQNEVLETMEEEDFPSFVTSDLYHKAITNLQLPTPISTPLSPPSEDTSTLPPQISTRRRSSSNPLWAKPSTSVPIPTPDSRRTRTPSPIPPIPLPGKGIAVQRTETLPPQVTFENPFDSPPKARRNGTDGPKDLHSSRKASSTSLDTLQSTSSRKGAAALSDSLEFLMASPTPEKQTRSPLFDEAAALPDDGHGDGLTHSPNSDDDYIQVQTIEAIQDALNSILETNGRPTSASDQQSTSSSPETNRRKAKDGLRRNLPPPRHPSLSSFPSTSASTSTSSISSSYTKSPVLPPPSRSVSSSSAPLPTTRRQKAVFDDGELNDDLDLGEREPEFDPQSIQLAAPGDLHLPAEIVRLAGSLEKLKNQESVVGALIRKAELTGNTSELKILVKSQDSLRREIRAATFQKDQYESQESENKLTPAGTRVTIPGTTIGQAEGQNFQLYLVEVHQVNADGSFRSGWIVTRRYSEFASLYAKLRDKFVPARYLEFPSKRIVTSYSKEFIEQRKIGLERYLQASPASFAISDTRT